MQQTIILDYESAKVIIWNHELVGNMEDMEEIICEKFNIKPSSIEWMSGENIEIEFISD